MDVLANFYRAVAYAIAMLQLIDRISVLQRLRHCMTGSLQACAPCLCLDSQTLWIASVTSKSGAYKNPTASRLSAT